jgi:hypothetical protein
LGVAEEYTAEGCYRASVSEDMQALASGPISWANKPLKCTGILRTHAEQVDEAANDVRAEVIESGITVYGDKETRNRLTAVAKEYPAIWQEGSDTVDIPKDEWLTTLIKPDAKKEAVLGFIERVQAQKAGRDVLWAETCVTPTDQSQEISWISDTVKRKLYDKMEPG